MTLSALLYLACLLGLGCWLDRYTSEEVSDE